MQNVCSLILMALFSLSIQFSEASTVVPPVLIAPGEGWEITDYALSFTWQRQSFLDGEEEESASTWTINSYQLQVADNSQFDAPIIDIIQKAPGQNPDRIEAGDADDEESQEIAEILAHWTEIVHVPSTTLEEGTWYWRARAADSSDQNWSSPISFTISSDNIHRPITRPLSSDNPIFSFDMYDSDSGGWGENPDWSAYYDFFPDDIKPFIAFAIPHEGWGGYDSPSRTENGEVVRYADFIQPLTDLNIPILIKTGGPDGDPQNYLSATELEDLYQNNPNVLGVVTGENTWQAIDGYQKATYRETEVKWLQNVIKISGKYGKYVISGEGAYDFAWDKYLGKEAPANNSSRDDNDYEWLDQQLIKDNRDAFVPSSKNNIFWSHHQMDSAVLGASISGLVENHGIWAEAWYWTDAGFSNGVFTESTEPGEFVTMPQIFWLQMMLKSLANGAAVYHFGGESGVSGNRGFYDRSQDAVVDEDGLIYEDQLNQGNGTEYTSFWDMNGNSTLGFERYIIPFIRAVTSKHLIPNQNAVSQEIKIAIDPGPVERDKGNSVCYGHYAPLYRYTLGIENFIEPTSDMEEGEIEESASGCRYDLIPNNGRYFTIPVIPHPANQFALENIELVSIDALQTEQAILDLFNVNYPDRFVGNAWVNQIGNTIFVTNSHENRNIQQNFSIDLQGSLKTIAGNAMPHSYMMISNNPTEQSVWIHANAEEGVEYTDNRTTNLVMQWSGEPKVSVSPTSALVEQNWNADTKMLSLALSHSLGAVNASIVLEDTDSDGDGVHSADSLYTLVSEREIGQVPNGPYLYQNAPNPFNGSTVLRYEFERMQPVKLAIYSLGGQQVVQLVDTVQGPSYYELIWDGRDGDGRLLASGLYLARLLGDQVVQTRKLLLIR
jgi:hypothetical protein